jgi:hypothetical protein
MKTVLRELTQVGANGGEGRGQGTVTLLSGARLAGQCHATAPKGVWRVTKSTPVNPGQLQSHPVNPSARGGSFSGWPSASRFKGIQRSLGKKLRATPANDCAMSQNSPQIHNPKLRYVTLCYPMLPIFDPFVFFGGAPPSNLSIREGRMLPISKSAFHLWIIAHGPRFLDKAAFSLHFLAKGKK